MNAKHPLEFQKEAFVEIFSHARAYTNVVMVTGYAGIFALWTTQLDRITPATSMGVGLLLAISVSAFVGWELYGMVQRYISLSTLRNSIDNPQRTLQEMSKMVSTSQRLMRRLERSWFPTIFIAGGCAAAAMFMLISAFAHGLWLRYSDAALSSGSTVEFNFISLFLGGVLAGLVGFVCFRMEARINNRSARRGLATALEADLRSSIELFDQLIGAWETNSVILFDYLDQLTFVRSNYNTDRPHFGVLSDADMRNRMNYYFRTSYVTLNKLRVMQENIYRLGSDEPKAGLLEEIANQVDELRDHRQAASELADQLSIRFLAR